MKLQLQGLLVLWIICMTNGAPYSKYGRSCKDIGCLPRETCVMAYESCSFSQQENVSCGRYPTCKKNSDAQSTQQSSGASYNPNYNTASENTRPSNVNVNPPRAEAIDPNLVFGFPSNPNIHPQMPPQQIPLDIPRLPDNRQAFPATPNQGGGSYYNPGLYPAPTPPPNVFGPFRNKNVEKSTEPSLLDQFLYNKSPRNLSTINNANLNLTLFSPTYPSRTPSDPNASVWNFPATTKYTTQRTTTTTTTTRRPWTTKSPFYNPANPSYSGGGGYYGNRYGDDTTFGGFSRPTTRYTTKRPSSSGGFSSFFSDFSNILSGDVGKLIGGALSSRGGSSGGGGFGSFFGGGDTRPLIENRNYRGGLFSENSGSSTNYNAYPVTRYGQVSPSTPKPSSASHGNFGWKMT